MPAIDGITSGFNTSALISSITSTMSIPISRMKGDLKMLGDRQSAVAELSGLLEKLAVAAEGLDEEQEAWAWTPTSSNEDAVTLTADGDVVPGSWDIDVTSIARAQVSASDNYLDKAAAGTFAAGTMTVNVGGVDTDIIIDGTNDSPQGLADALDAVDGMTAYIVDDGSANPYRIVVRSDSSGTAGAVSFSGATPNFSETVTATDAVVEIDGMTVTSASNDLEIIPGITMTVKQETTSPVNVQVARDDEVFNEKIQGFVDAYNAVVANYEKGMAHNPDLGIEGKLRGDSTARRVMTKLSDLMGSEFTSGTLTSIGQLGVKTLQTGQLELDADALQAALDADPSAVRDLLIDTDGPMASLISEIRDVYVDEDDGLLSIRTESLESSEESLTDRIEMREKQLSATVSRLRTKFEYMEATMARMQATGAMLSGLLSGLASPSDLNE